MASETNDTIAWIPDAVLAQITFATTATSGDQTGAPSVAGDYTILRGIKHSVKASIAAPAAFTVGQWSVAGGTAEDTLAFTISALPNRNGTPVTKFQYALNADQGSPTWVDLPAGTTTGTYIATGLTGGTTYTGTIGIRAVTAVGGGAVSDLKTATVTAGSVNLITNGGFADATNWSLVNSGINITGGKLAWVASAAGARAQQTLAAGEQPAGNYDYEITTSGYTGLGFGFRIQLYSGSTNVGQSATIATDGLHTGTITASAPFTLVRLAAAGNSTTVSADDFSLVSAA